ncbi:MAG: hypothetical protein WBV06_17285 [Acidimicrobiia bacterium]
MSRLESRLLAVVFVLLISVPLVAFAVGLRPQPNQNRPPTPLPDLTMQGILDRQLTPQLDRYLEDSLIIAPTAVAAEAWTDVAIGDNPNPEVTIGTNGWLYYTYSLTRPCLTPADVTAFVDVLDRASRVVEATGRHLIVAIAPDKASIVPDFLPDGLDTCVNENAAALNALDGPDNLVTVWDEMRAARADELPIYFRLDTHWTNEGAGVMAEALVNRLVPGGWDADAVQQIDTVDQEGDLTDLLGLPSGEETVEQEAVLPGDHTRVERRLLTAAGNKYEKAVAVDFTSTDPVIPGHTLVMHDSYGWALTPMLAPYFGDASFIHETNPAAGHMWDDLQAADTIIHVSVQRSLQDIITGPDLAAEFVAAFADEFDPIEQGTQTTGERLELAPAAGDTYVVVELAPGADSAEVAYNDITAKLNPDSPRAAFYVGTGGTMYFAGEVEYRVVTIR